ncbi:MAG TPA: DUF4215 domain-containing protein [Sandaracinaceae bacterium LLY-WYZ-13_1]|nr:DUF4215 domain-containing protein [Sandaracinaceae bacterium LLY-WYZ-13_1]
MKIDPALPSTLALTLLVACASGGGEGTDAGAGPSMDTGTPERGVDGGPDLCGNGAIDPGEECDGTALDGQTCVSLGYVAGELTCLPDCTFDKTVCEEDACGNGAIDDGEACDGAELDDQTCASLGFVGGGTLACDASCDFDTSDCRACGDGSVDEGEECDGSDLDGVDCEARGFTDGELACDASCAFDESGCFDASCGDGTRGGSEDCDGSDLGGASCADVGFYDGTLGCNADCTYRVADCHNCGNGSIEGIEECDGSDLGSAGCTTLGFTMGSLGCTATCTYDTSGCSTAACGNGSLESGEECDDGNAADTDGCTSSCTVEAGWTCVGTPSSCSPICGDGRVLGGEDCDGTDLNGESCTSRGFDGGALACASCAFDESGCTTTSCGNGSIEPSAGEECDDGNTVSFDGCDSSCHVDAGYYLPVRLRDGDGSNHGMLEVHFEGAWREVCDDTYDAAARDAMAEVVCGQLGYTGTGHEFLTSFGGGSGDPAMDDVYCTGSEASLAQCEFGGWELENCSGGEAVGIRCVPGEGDVRLVDGPHGMEGRLQVFHGGAWGEVCDDYFDGYYSAYYGYSHTTVCQQLGYRGGTFVGTYDAPGDDFVLDDVNCTGTERRIGDCPHQPWGTENCSRTEGAGFRCEIYQDDDVRLVDGTARNSGRVEVLHSGVWGTVCDDYLSSSGSRQDRFISVTCGQLGFSGAGTALLTSSVPDGADPIWMDDVDCGGAEAALPMCPFGGWGLENCSHYEDIGLTCTP